MPIANTAGDGRNLLPAPATLLSFLDSLALVVAAMGTDAVGLLHLVAVGTLGERWTSQMVVRAASTRPPLGMTSLWIRHCTAPRSRLARGNTRRHSEQGRILWALRPEIYCFLSQSCFNRARGARRGSVAWVSHRHSSWFRLAPHVGHNPRQSLWQITFIGNDSSTCSFSTSARNKPSPSKNPISVSSSFNRSASGFTLFSSGW